MKKVLLLAIGCQFSVISFAQITITDADMPQPGDTIRLSTITDTTGLPAPALTGAGITWDYSKLKPVSQTIDTFLSVSSTPLLYQLYFNTVPAYKATVAQTATNLPALGPVSITKVINFYKDESTNYESVGYGANIDGVPTSVKDDSIDVVYKFPMKYGNSDSCHSNNAVSIPVIGSYMEHQYRINHVEGWGTLITPFGTFSTLKIKTLIYTFDSLYFDTLHFGIKTLQTEQIQYKWLAKGQPEPLLQINEDVLLNKPVYVNTVYRDSARKLVAAGIARINSSLNNVSLYPNPIDIRSTEPAILSYELNNASLINIIVYSVDGRCAGKLFNGEQTAGKHNLSLTPYSLSLTPGIYLLKIEANGQQAVKKLVIE